MSRSTRNVRAGRRARTATGLAVAALAPVAVVAEADLAAADVSIVVETFDDETADNGKRSLREAVIEASAVLDGVATIELPAGLYVLDECGANDPNVEDDNSEFGDLDYFANSPTADLVIDGDGATIQQTCLGQRVLHGVGVSPMLVANTQLTGGHTFGDGGGIYAPEAEVVLWDNASVLDNSADNGGGIYAQRAQVLDSGVIDNHARVDGGGVRATTGIYVAGSTVFVNSAAASGGGLSADGLVTTIDTFYNQNRAGFGAPDVFGVGAAIHAATVTSLDNHYVLNRVDEGGGAIASAGPVASEDDEFIDNASQGGSGGAIEAGDVEVVNGTLTSNFAAGSGGAIASTGTVIVRQESTLDLNRSVVDGGAISASRRVEVRESQLLENTADDGAGGAVRVENDQADPADVVIVGSLLAHNDAELEGGAVAARSVVPGTVDITESVFDDNDALEGAGGAVVGQNVEVSASELRDNRAWTKGGAISATDVVIDAATFAGNEAWQQQNPALNIGGAIAALRVETTNATFSGNTAEAGGGAISAQRLETLHSTFADNAVPAGGAGAHVELVIFVDNEPVGLSTRSTVFAGPADDGCSFGQGVTVASQGYNVDSGNTCQLAEALDEPDSGDVGLLPLADNGGPTRTHMPAPGSALIDLEVDDQCALAVDQRGVDRPLGEGCDSGAVELAPPPPPPPPPPAASLDVEWTTACLSGQPMATITILTTGAADLEVDIAVDGDPQIAGGDVPEGVETPFEVSLEPDGEGLVEVRDGQDKSLLFTDSLTTAPCVPPADAPPPVARPAAPRDHTPRYAG